MSKIRNVKDLQEEIARLNQLSGYQWRQLGYDVKEIREDFMPRNMLRKFIRFAGAWWKEKTAGDAAR